MMILIISLDTKSIEALFVSLFAPGRFQGCSRSNLKELAFDDS